MKHFQNLKQPENIGSLLILAPPVGKSGIGTTIFDNLVRLMCAFVLKVAERKTEHVFDISILFKHSCWDVVSTCGYVWLITELWLTKYRLYTSVRPHVAYN